MTRHETAASRPGATGCTVFAWAAVLSRTDEPIPDAVRASLRAVIGRNAELDLLEHADHRSHIVAVARSGGSSNAGWNLAPDGTLIVTAGDPVLPKTGSTLPSGETESSMGKVRGPADHAELFTHARGTFATLIYEPGHREYVAIADKLGVRPVYAWVDSRFAVFATTLRAFEQCALVPKAPDLRGVLETATLGYPLADRTRYENVRAMYGGELLRVGPETSRQTFYWRWDSVEQSSASREDQARNVSECFIRAVRDRVGDRQHALAFLSGGLDSRCIVAALFDLGVDVQSLNYGSRGTQDSVFAQAFAGKLGVQHYERALARGVADPDLFRIVAADRSDVLQRLEDPNAAGCHIWSGDGGSVGLGYVYVNEAVVDAMRRGRIHDAVDLHLRELGAILPKRALTLRYSEQFGDVIRDGVAQEIGRIEGSDPGRVFHVYLLHNDQRRHVARFFEDVDMYGYDLTLPFFDSALMEAVLQVPLDWCLGHRFYLDSLGTRLPHVLSTPWQAYPGHIPCPLPVNDQLIYQWNRTDTLGLATNRSIARRWMALLRARDFPGHIIRRWYLASGMLAHLFRLRDTAHLLEWSTRCYDLLHNPDAADAP